MYKAGAFHMAKFISNDQQVIESVPLRTDQRVLGILTSQKKLYQWNVHSDYTGVLRMTLLIN